eukprot:scaffold1180_cov130-Skeletonema_menzelii.AAC.5
MVVSTNEQSGARASTLNDGTKDFEMYTDDDDFYIKETPGVAGITVRSCEGEEPYCIHLD